MSVSYLNIFIMLHHLFLQSKARWYIFIINIKILLCFIAVIIEIGDISDDY